MRNDVSGSLSYSAEPYGVNSTMITITLNIELRVNTLTILSITESNETMEPAAGDGDRARADPGILCAARFFVILKKSIAILQKYYII